MNAELRSWPVRRSLPALSAAVLALAISAAAWADDPHMTLHSEHYRVLLGHGAVAPR